MDCIICLWAGMVSLLLGLAQCGYCNTCLQFDYCLLTWVNWAVWFKWWSYCFILWRFLVQMFYWCTNYPDISCSSSVPLCWPLVPKFAGSHPAEAVGIFRAKKSSAHLLSEGEVKPSVPCRSFTACKRSLNVTYKSAFRQNYRTFLAHSSTFRRWVFSRGDTPGGESWNV